MPIPAQPTPLVIAHRGASGYRPEHTRSAYELAIALGADAVEPDLVASSDGVLVIRHENEISGTTDVASRPEFADRRTTTVVDGETLTGWFTEDFTWAELSTLTARERLPTVRPGSAAFDGHDGILRLETLLELLDQHSERPVGMVAEIKHASHFAALGLDLAGLFADVVSRTGWAGSPRLTVESFELGPLQRIRELGVGARFVYLLESAGAPVDRPASSYSSSLTDAGLAELAGVVEGISVDSRLILTADESGAAMTTDLVSRAHAAGLAIYCWTLRAENRFLLPVHRVAGLEGEFGDWMTEFGLIVASGVDGVFADQPDLAIAARAAR